MDRGELFKDSFSVKLGMNGSYLVVVRERFDTAMQSQVMGFSNVHDMMAFLNSEYEATKLQGAQAPS